MTKRTTSKLVVLLALLVWAVNVMDALADSGFFPTGYQDSWCVEFNATERALYVVHANEEDGLALGDRFTKLDADTFAIVDEFTVTGQAVGEFIYLQSESKIYFINMLTAQLVEYDCTLDTVTRSVAVEPYPRSLLISPDGFTIFVSCGEYPKFGPSSDPDYLAPRRGKLLKIDRASFSVVDSETSYSGPVEMAINSAGTRLYLANAVQMDTRSGDSQTDLWSMIEVFDPSTLNLIREFEVGYPCIGDGSSDHVILGGCTEFDRPPLLLDMALDQTTVIDTSTLGNHRDRFSALSTDPALNNGFILTSMYGDESPCSFAVIDLTTLSVSPYTITEPGHLNRIFIDEAGNQLILWSKEVDGLYSVSPIP